MSYCKPAGLLLHSPLRWKTSAELEPLFVRNACRLHGTLTDLRHREIASSCRERGYVGAACFWHYTAGVVGRWLGS